MGIQAFINAGISLDLFVDTPQNETCVYDMSPSCADNFF